MLGPVGQDQSVVRDEAAFPGDAPGLATALELPRVERAIRLRAEGQTFVLQEVLRALRARDEDDVEVRLQLPHALAHRGTRDPELARGSDEAARARNGEKRLELGEGDAAHMQ